jgi:hypothetical protein
MNGKTDTSAIPPKMMPIHLSRKLLHMQYAFIFFVSVKQDLYARAALSLASMKSLPIE